MNRLVVVDHPLVSHKLTVLRDEDTDSPTFRRLTDEQADPVAIVETRDAQVFADPAQSDEQFVDGRPRTTLRRRIAIVPPVVMTTTCPCKLIFIPSPRLSLVNRHSLFTVSAASDRAGRGSPHGY